MILKILAVLGAVGVLCQYMGLLNETLSLAAAAVVTAAFVLPSFMHKQLSGGARVVLILGVILGGYYSWPLDNLTGVLTAFFTGLSLSSIWLAFFEPKL